MRKFSILVLTTLLTFIAVPAFPENLVLLNGTIIDGSGRPRTRGNVRIRDGKITHIGAFRALAGETTIDVNGLVVAPGFIDIHNHSTPGLRNDLGAPSQITQGITTIVLGPDGSGAIAIEDFMMAYDDEPPALNILTFVGHGTVRRSIMREDYKRPATPLEILQMEDLVEFAMREGAFGLSSDLENEPGSYATTAEVIALAKVAARYGGTYMTHMRDESGKVLDSIREAIEIGREAKIPVQISHLKLGSEAVWGRATEVLGEIDKARMQGIDIAADVYPYTVSVTGTDGPAALPSMTDKDIRAFVRHAWVMIASDAGVTTRHPRAAGTFPRVLGPLVRDEKVLTLEQAIRKMSGLPASRLGLKERGTLRVGGAADVVVFDPASIRDKSTAEDPFALPEGMKFVFVNGTIVLRDGQPNGARPGLALR
jgi:N-acyl-D-aspartate/D-glutamate deacylase